MAIAIPTLALLVLALAIPNYVAVRYAVFGGSPVAPVNGGTVLKLEAHRKRRLADVVRRGYLWKALSPLVFALSMIVGIGLGGVVGLSLVGLAALNLVYGLLGWDGYRPLR